MREFCMPSLGADMAEGTLVEWLVQPGAVVHRGDLIATVDTSKSAIDIEIFADGVVERFLVEPGSTVAVGTPIALIADAAEGRPTPAPRVAPAARAEKPARAPRKAKQAKVPPAVPPAGPPAVSPAGPRVAASPLARRRAHELGVDLASVHPAHTQGVVTVADVLAAASAAPPPSRLPATPEPAPAAEPSASATDRAAAMRAAIGALMARSKREIPHYTLQETFDIDAPLGWLERANADRPVAERIVPAALLLKATAVAARQFADMNGFFVDGSYRPSPAVHLGVAVSLRGGGLIAPAIHDADTLSLADLMAAMKDLVARARSGRLRGSEMADPTLTVTNLGELGAEAVHGVIYPPQVALVGFGRIMPRPWAIDGMLAVRRTVIATLAADHRVSDGHRGGLFLAAINAALQRPEEL